MCGTPAPFELRRPSLRLTVDTRQDLQFVRSLVDQAGDAALLPLGQVIALADSIRGLGRCRMIPVTRLDGSTAARAQRVRDGAGGEPPRRPRHPHAVPAHVEVIVDAAGFAALQPEWNRLLEASGSGNIFLTWEWVSLWWAILRGR